MEVLYYISDCMIPFVILYLVGYGMCKKVDIFDSFIEGAKDGFLTVYKILPTLIGLMIGVGILRQSGFMEWLAGMFAPVVNILHFPGELLPLFIVKMFSSSAATGKIGEIGTAALDSSKEAVTLCITMLGIMSMWTGLMNIAKKAGIIDALTKALRPVLAFLFPGVPKEHKANEYMAANMISNVLGLGWAATPVGLKAMEELKKLNHGSHIASADMCTFLIINISSLQLIPVNIIAYRSQYGSASPASILGMGLVATIVSTAAGVIFSVIARKVSKKKGER